MTEVLISSEDKKLIEERVAEAKTTDEIVALREIAANIGSRATSVAIESPSGEMIEVTSIGTQKFAELAAVDPQTLQNAMVAESAAWRNEEK